MAHSLDHTDSFVMHRALGVAAVVRHPVEHRAEHRLEDGSSQIRPDAAMDAKAEPEVAIAFSVQDNLVGLREHRCVAVGHGPGDVQALTLFELCPIDLDVLGERPPVTRRRGVETQELLGGRVKQGVALERRRSRWSGFCPSHSSEWAVRAVVVSNPPPMSSVSIPRISMSGAGCPSIRNFSNPSMIPGRGLSRISATLANRAIAIC